MKSRLSRNLFPSLLSDTIKSKKKSFLISPEVQTFEDYFHDKGHYCMTNQFLQRGRRPLWNSLVRKLKKRKETDNKAKENFAVHSNPSACSKPRSFTSQVATCIKKSTGIYRPQEDEIRRHRTLVTVIDFATIPLDLLTAFEREP